MQSLPNLKKLYMDCNKVSRVSGLYGCSALEELHLSDQRIDPGVSLEFNNGSLTSIGGSLKVFIAQGNNIPDVGKLVALRELEAARKLRSSIPKAARPTLLLGVLAESYVGRIRRAQFNVFDPSVGTSAGLATARLACRALIGRY